jgi:hypothetical protein
MDAMKFAQSLTLVVCAALLSSCGGKDLSQEQAKSLLNAFFDTKPTTKQLLTGMDNIGIAPEKDYFATAGGKYQKFLEADGLITITSKGKIFRPGSHTEFFNALDIQLTDKGKALMVGKSVTVPAPSANTWPTVYENANFCSQEVAAISNIATNDDFARVEYTWHAAKLTAFATDFQKADPTEKVTCNPAVSKSESASFERAGDVWKLTSAQ